jgi:ABC-type multidrug transport system fused ATPase/permease subunit
MDNPIKMLREIVKDPIEFTSITLPSAALVAVLFSYKELIYLELKALPSPLGGNPYGLLLFLALTLIVSMLVKVVSHDLLNWTYDKFYRNPKRRNRETFYGKLFQQSGELGSQYKDTLAQLVQTKNPILVEVELLQTQSKLARSVSLILFLIAVVLFLYLSFLPAVICVLVSFYMLYTFYKFRWDACELAYEAKFKASET